MQVFDRFAGTCGRVLFCNTVYCVFGLKTLCFAFVRGVIGVLRVVCWGLQCCAGFFVADFSVCGCGRNFGWLSALLWIQMHRCGLLFV